MKKDYTLDYIANTDTYVYQRKDMFRINSDTSLLAQFMHIKENEKVLDVGTNNGALLLHAAKRKPQLLYGIDIQKDACEVARYNMEAFHIENVQIECVDFNDFKKRNFDVIISNPPYFKQSANREGENDMRAIARHEKYLKLETLLQMVAKCLQSNGRFYMVHRVDRLVEIVSLCEQNELAIKTLQVVYDKQDKQAKSLLVEAIYKGKDSLTMLPPKYI